MYNDTVKLLSTCICFIIRIKKKNSLIINLNLQLKPSVLAQLISQLGGWGEVCVCVCVCYGLQYNFTYYSAQSLSRV